VEGMDGIEATGVRSEKDAPDEEEEEVMLMRRGGRVCGKPSNCCGWKGVKSVVNIFGSKCNALGSMEREEGSKSRSIPRGRLRPKSKAAGSSLTLSLSQRLENWDQSGGLSGCDEPESDVVGRSWSSIERKSDHFEGGHGNIRNGSRDCGRVAGHTALLLGLGAQFLVGSCIKGVRV
jgi:hypothetical protein